MASQVPTPEADAAIASAGAALQQGWAAALSGGGSDPAPPAAPSAPEPAAVPAAPASASAPAVPPTAQPPASPAPPGAAAPVAGQPVPNITDANAKYFLDLYHGDVNAALAAAVTNNNRLAAIAKANPDVFKTGGAGDPSTASQLPNEPFVDPSATAQPAAQPAAAVGEPAADAPVELDWAQVKQGVDSLVAGDAECQQLISAFRENAKEIIASDTQRRENEARIAYLDQMLKDPQVELSELRREDLIEERRTLKLDTQALKQDILLRQLNNQNLDSTFRVRQRSYIDRTVGEHQTAATDRARQAELTRLESAEESRMLVEWPAAVQAAVVANQIPAEVAGIFADFAKRSVQAARATNPSFYLQDVAGFVHSVVPIFLKEMDTIHRAQAARYATNAVNRATTPAPPPPPGSPVVPAAPAGVHETPESIMENIGRELSQRMRGMR